MVLVEQSKVVTRSCRAVSAELIRRVKCCRKDMQRFIVPMEKSSLVERRPARQRHGIKCQPHKKCQIANNEVAYGTTKLEKALGSPNRRHDGLRWLVSYLPFSSAAFSSSLSARSCLCTYGTVSPRNCTASFIYSSTRETNR